MTRKRAETARITRSAFGPGFAYQARPTAVAKLYTMNAILHGTRSNNVTVGREAITKYFMVVVNSTNRTR